MCVRCARGHALTRQTFAIFWTFAGLAGIGAAVLAGAQHGRPSAHDALTAFDASHSGWPAGWSFCVGLLQAAYATSSTGMVVSWVLCPPLRASLTLRSMCEEVRQPAVQVPRAMVGAVIVNTVGGLLFLVPLLFVLPPQASLVAVASAQPVPTMLVSATGHAGAALGLLVPLLVLALCCGIGCTTAASRRAAPGRLRATAPSRARAGGAPCTPGSGCRCTPWREILLGAFSGAGVVFLTLSYAAPIAASLLGGRQHVATGRFHLGVLGAGCNVVALAWSALAVPLFCMPPALPVTPSSMNYASAVLVGFLAVAGAWYLAWGQQHYRGPPCPDAAG